jgi:iron complex transport system substrate-binding protein
MTKQIQIAGWILLYVLLSCALLAQQKTTPNRIISMVPAITEMLFAIGAGPQVVAVSSFDRAKDVESLPRVGALLDPDIERVFSLRPDLVVIYESQIDQQVQMARVGIPVFAYRHGGLTDIIETVRELGERTGHVIQANALADTIEEDLDFIRSRVASLKPTPALIVFGREPNAIRNVYASGGVGFLHEMLEIAGGRNVFADVSSEAVHPSSEMILAAAPEVILELRAEGVTENGVIEDVAAWQMLSTVPAVRAGRVHFLTGSELVIPGPRVAEVTRRFAQLLQPKAFGRP